MAACKPGPAEEQQCGDRAVVVISRRELTAEEEADACAELSGGAGGSGVSSAGQHGAFWLKKLSEQSSLKTAVWQLGCFALCVLDMQQHSEGQGVVFCCVCLTCSSIHRLRGLTTSYRVLLWGGGEDTTSHPMTALNKLKAWQKAHQHWLVHTVTTNPIHANQSAPRTIEPATRTGQYVHLCHPAAIQSTGQSTYHTQTIWLWQLCKYYCQQWQAGKEVRRMQ